MIVSQKLVKPIKEVNYLRAENAQRYRVIIRYFFLEYEKIHYWMGREDIYEMMRTIGLFPDYTLEQCQLDLQALVDWGNLTAQQDGSKVKTIQDFKNKKYRYQLSEYTVEIERMTTRLENLEVEGASLEPTLLERIYQQLSQYEALLEMDDASIRDWLTLLIEDFIRLNRNYQDYIKTLNSAKAEELMKTTEFLIFKDKLITYLRNFVVMMQEKGGLIIDVLNKVDDATLEFLLNKATNYELSIPRLDSQLKYEDVYENFKGKLNSLKTWFVGGKEVSEMDRLNDITNDIIRKITRYASHIAEMNNRGSNRKEQYYHLMNVFSRCENVNQAHCLSAHVFGVDNCMHLAYIQERLSDNINMGVYQENPSFILFEPHAKIARKKTVREPAKDYTLEKTMQLLEREDAIELEKRRIEDIVVNNEIDFSTLPLIHATTRKKLLLWLSKALESKSNKAKTDDDREYHVIKISDELCTLRCEDGNFMMPKYKIVFKGK